MSEVVKIKDYFITIVIVGTSTENNKKLGEKLDRKAGQIRDKETTKAEKEI
jgi:hypothetical protein